MAEDSLSRRDFLKGISIATATVLIGSRACKAFDTLFGYQPPEPTPPLPSVPESQDQTEVKPEALDSASDMIVFGKPDKDIWQTNLQPGQGISQAVKTKNSEVASTGFALTWISANRSRAVQFSGPEGLGSRALLVWDKLIQDSSQYGLDDLARFNPRTASPQDTIIFGNTAVVNKNFQDLLGSDKLSSIAEYLTVNLGFNDENQTWSLGLNRTKHLFPGDPDYSSGIKEWQAVPLKGFIGDRDGNWTRNL